MTNNIIEKSKNKSDKQKRLEKKQEEENKLKKQEDIKNIVENIENLIESYKDNSNIYHKYDDFINGESNILFIVGLSGSGKTTLADKLAREHNAKHINLDIYYYEDNPNHFLNDIWKSFISKYDIRKELKINDYELDFEELTSKENDKLTYDWFKYRVDYVLRHKNEKFILEGVQTLFFNNLYETFINYPIIVLETGLVSSIFNAIKRDIKYKNYNFIDSIIHNYSVNKDNIEQRLEEFKKYITSNSLNESTPFITNNTFYRNGITYDVDKLIKLTYKNKPVLFNINLLKEFLKNNPIYKNRYEEERIYQADLSTPILVWKSPNNVWNIIDGKHRTQKALDNGIEGLPAYVISDNELEKAIRKYTKDGSLI